MPSFDLSNKSILLVDDVSFSRVTLGSMLARMGNPIVHQANSGASAMAFLQSENWVDIIISDFNMPEMHGLQLLQSVRVGENGIRRDLPFAMVTGYSEKPLVDTALELDVNAFLIKPVSKLGLERRLQRMMQNMSSDVWLKSTATYGGVNVASDLGYVHDTRHDGDTSFTVRDVRPKPGAKSKPFAAPLDIPEEIEVPFDAKSARVCLIQDVPDHAILAKDIYTSEGRKYIRAGDVLTPQKLSLLADLNELGNSEKEIWIKR